MSKYRINHEAVCPYHLGIAHQMLRCEGVDPGTVTNLSFASYDAYRRYMATYCNEHYKLCRIAQMLERKWDEQT